MVLGLEFLEADNVRPLPFKPTQEICKPLIDVINVKGCNLHFRLGQTKWAIVDRPICLSQHLMKSTQGKTVNRDMTRESDRALSCAGTSSTAVMVSACSEGPK